MGMTLLLPHSSATPTGFRKTADRLVLDGYQMYAVDHWLLARQLPTPVLLVHTGNLHHKIVVSLFQANSEDHWDNTLDLFRPHAKPKSTPEGNIMVTSLAQFRSDYTIVHIPDGDLDAARSQLYTNINLLTLGCSGRSGLTLEEPSDTTKERFTSTYCLPWPKSNSVFNSNVLELVRFVQISLSIFGHYSGEFDGLLCDITVEGIRNWVSQFGSTPEERLDPLDKVAGPSVISALLSLVIAVRNKLVVVSSSATPITKDPFLNPRNFSRNISHYLSSIPQSITYNSSTQSNPSHHSPRFSIQSPTLPTFLKDHHPDTTTSLPTVYNTPTSAKLPSITPVPSPSRSPAISLSLNVPTPPSSGFLPSPARVPPTESDNNIHLTRSLVDKITSAYESKLSRTSVDARRSARRREKGKDKDDDRRESRDSLSLPIPNRVPGLTHIPLPLALASGSLSSAQGAASIVKPVFDLKEFVDIVVGEDMEVKKEDESDGSDDGLGKATAKMKARVRPKRHKDKGAVHGVAGSVKALWMGCVDEISKARKKVEDMLREQERAREERGVLSDGGGGLPKRRTFGSLGSDSDEPRRPSFSRRGSLKSGNERSDGRTTEEEGALDTFGALWARGSRVSRKIESWTVFNTTRKKTHSHNSSASNIVNGSSNNNVVDLSTLSKRRGHNSLLLPGFDGASANTSAVSTPMRLQTVFQWPKTGDPEDEDLLSSGQNSPVGQAPVSSPFVGPRLSIDTGSNARTGEVVSQKERLATDKQLGEESGGGGGKKVKLRIPESKRLPKALLGKRMPPTNRVSSWADPLSARQGELDGDSEDDLQRIWRDSDEDRLSNEDVLQGEKKYGVGMRERDKRGPNRTSSSQYLGDSLHQHRRGQSAAGGRDGVEESFSGVRLRRQEEGMKKRPLGLSPTRRRSFHDLGSFRGCYVLSTERMKIDVELCGNFIIMRRREEHIKNVIAALERIVIPGFHAANAALREHYERHVPDLTEVSDRAKVIAAVDMEHANSNKFSQATKTLQYEAEQFVVPDLWHIASPPRQKVFDMREKVFGTGGRKLPTGAHGAHGQFNRLQWTLDGQERLVDYLGRTEEEAEEERRIDPEARFIPQLVEDEEDAVEHPSIKPMWLLRFFTSWAKWGSTALTSRDKSKAPSEESRAAEDKVKPDTSKADSVEEPVAVEEPQKEKVVS
ncbi:hypothetical protein K435DRAFT_740733 [Dendrothele bispora CBS 962.96]|uniref:STB6-like N-terminal domain-containing protein n=1 Tax=Dendrothele bispora (strain CBS 962.96) TaxID=1314807 RepID=A0A4S8MYM1_DENBC|nr:hypothetical protein K435DRAFT_740733 [Dendrothele bispora CBS 962.96]